MDTQDRPTVPAAASTEERTYEAVKAGQLPIYEAARIVEAHRLSLLMAESLKVAA